MLENMLKQTTIMKTNKISKQIQDKVLEKYHPSGFSSKLWTTLRATSNPSLYEPSETVERKPSTNNQRLGFLAIEYIGKRVVS